jgi:hypothetical protein
MSNDEFGRKLKMGQRQIGIRNKIEQQENTTDS